MDNTATLETISQTFPEQEERPKVTITRSENIQRGGIKGLLNKITHFRDTPRKALEEIADLPNTESQTNSKYQQLMPLDEQTQENLDPLETQLNVEERSSIKKLADNLSVGFYSMALWHKLSGHPEIAVGLLGMAIGGIAAANALPIDPELLARISIALGLGSAASSKVSGVKRKVIAGIAGAGVGIAFSEGKQHIAGPSEHGPIIDFGVGLLDDIPTAAAIAPKAAELAPKVTGKVLEYITTKNGR